MKKEIDLSEDLNSDFLNPDILKFAKFVSEKDARQAKILRETYRRREQVNYKALEIVEDKGAELCSSMFAVMAEELDEVAAIAEMGWAVQQFVGVGHAFNRMSEMVIGIKNLDAEDDIDWEKAVMYRVFAIAAVRWGIPHVESESFDQFVRPLYAAQVSIPDEDLWDQAHARLQLENAELDVFWNEDEVANRFIEENNDDELD